MAKKKAQPQATARVGKVYSYSRFSSDDQRLGDSMRRQSDFKTC